MSNEDENKGADPLTPEKINLRLGDLSGVLKTEHPNSTKYKEAVAEIESLNQMLDDIESQSDDEPVQQAESQPKNRRQATLSECLAYERKQKVLAIEAAKKKGK